MLKVKKANRAQYPAKLRAVVRISNDMRVQMDRIIVEQEVTDSDIVRDALSEYLKKH